MLFGECPTCGEFCEFRNHRCPPLWYVMPDWYEDDTDATTVFADDAKAACEAYVAENFCNLDYPEEAEVRVRAAEGEWEKYVVTHQMTPVFHAAKTEQP